MPNENKITRGRRQEKTAKRKRADDNADHQKTKRRRSSEIEDIQFVGTDNAETVREDFPVHAVGERPFYGLLDDEEQEYFRRADELLELNDFPSNEERTLFLANIYKEAEGKELKIANSQSCSRLMERLIILSTTEQKKNLFEKFSGQFSFLIQHRFASHCCETLFIHSAPVVTQELTGENDNTTLASPDGDRVYVSMENLFLYTLNELEGQMGFLLTDRFASHALRVLLVVLSGQPLEKSSTKTLLQSRKKEKIGIAGLDSINELSLETRAVPTSFQFAVDKFISDTAAGLDSTSIPVLAVHQTGNPSLQLLLELELTRQGKKKASTDSSSIIRKFLPDDIEAPNSQSAAFINGLMYDPIGSRLLETIVKFAPGKLFKQIYRTTFKDRIGSLARNEIASYIVVKVLERLSKEDLEEAVTAVLPQFTTLVERSRTTIIKTLFERCHARNATASLETLTTALSEAYGSDSITLVLQMTQFVVAPPTEPPSSGPNPVETKPSATTLHGSLLAQSLLRIPGKPTLLLQTALLALPLDTLLALSLSPTTSHIIQTALQPSPPPQEPNLTFRRKLVNAFLSSSSPSPVSVLAVSKAGSHVLDAMFAGTEGLMSLKERICALLAEEMPALREDFVGRVVLRNWMVETFVRRRSEWVAKVKNGEGGGVTTTKARGVYGKGVTAKQEKKVKANGKTAIELARENFAAGTSRKTGKGRGTGANATFASE